MFLNHLYASIPVAMCLQRLCFFQAKLDSTKLTKAFKYLEELLVVLICFIFTILNDCLWHRVNLVSFVDYRYNVKVLFFLAYFSSLSSSCSACSMRNIIHPRGESDFPIGQFFFLSSTMPFYYCWLQSPSMKVCLKTLLTPFMVDWNSDKPPLDKIRCFSSIKTDIFNI